MSQLYKTGSILRLGLKSDRPPLDLRVYFNSICLNRAIKKVFILK